MSHETALFPLPDDSELYLQILVLFWLLIVTSTNCDLIKPDRQRYYSPMRRVIPIWPSNKVTITDFMI